MEQDLKIVLANTDFLLPVHHLTNDASALYLTCTHALVPKVTTITSTLLLKENNINLISYTHSMRLTLSAF